MKIYRRYRAKRLVVKDEPGEEESICEEVDTDALDNAWTKVLAKQ
jgi:hypothetical protein